MFISYFGDVQVFFQFFIGTSIAQVFHYEREAERQECVGWIYLCYVTCMGFYVWYELYVFLRWYELYRVLPMVCFHVSYLGMIKGDYQYHVGFR